MAFRLTQKEQQLLKDQSSHEKVCIEKYSNYAQRARDPRLKQMFYEFASQEQDHYDTINQMLSGQTVNLAQSQGRSQSQSQSQGRTDLQANRNTVAGQQGQQLTGQQGSAGMTNQEDASLLSDMLMTEKFVSGAYDTAIFESANPNVRQTLQHIQDEEQQHGEGIFNYMSQQGMYNPQ